MEFENLIKLIDTVSRSELTGFKYEAEGIKLHMSKNMKITAVSGDISLPVCEAGRTVRPEAGQNPADTDGTEESENNGNIVVSPLVGTFYAAPAEDAKPFVSVGDIVKKGQTLAIIEAMKLMNEIESEYDGTVTEVLAENGRPVEYGQPLFRIEKRRLL